MSIASTLAALAAFAGVLGAVGLGAELLGAASRWRSLVRRPTGMPAHLQVLLGRLGRELASVGTLRRLGPGDLEARLVAAAEPAGLGVREWIAVKTGCALFTGLAALLVAAGAPTRIAVVLTAGSLAVGFLVPDLWLARVVRRRIHDAVRELPDMLDLLRVTVEAGMPPARALGVVGAEFRGTLALEWRRVASEIELGLPQDQAYAGLRARLPADELSSLVEILTRARRHGVPLGRALALQAVKARERRRRRVREQAARAGPKVQLAVALLLVPAVLLIVAAGVLVELERSGPLLGT